MEIPLAAGFFQKGEQQFTKLNSDIFNLVLEYF